VRRQSIQVVQGGLRTGTDNVAVGLPSLSGNVGMDFGTANTNVPSVWRTNRSQASERVSALASGGMEDVEIPAFLRKQAD
jgi:cell division protein FtsZ